jgi:hypothetical protein
MTRPIIGEHDMKTNLYTEREMNDEEFTAYVTEQDVMALRKTASDNLVALKASAISKLVAGKPLTEDEAKTVVL